MSDTFAPVAQLSSGERVVLVGNSLNPSCTNADSVLNNGGVVNMNGLNFCTAGNIGNVIIENGHCQARCRFNTKKD